MEGKWEEIYVGYILSLLDGEKIPADILILATDNTDGTCYAGGSVIFGDHNVKLKKSISETQKLLHKAEFAYIYKKIAGKIKVPEPNKENVSFSGQMIFKLHPKSFDISNDNMIFRGTELRGCKSILGIVIYAGEETKLHMNIKNPPKKTSRLERKINEYVVFILFFLVFIVSFSVILQIYYFKTTEGFSGIQSYINFILLYNYIIPISLFVTMDIIRFFQVVVIHKQLQNKVKFKTGDLNENLGQVEFILTNKTGTLTKNEVTLETCFIDNEVYVKENIDQNIFTVGDEYRPLKSGIVVPENPIISTTVDAEKSQSENSPRAVNRLSLSNLKVSHLIEEEDSLVLNFVKCMALCNSVMIENAKFWKFDGLSKEEKLMVESACDFGIKTIFKNFDNATIEVAGILETYKLFSFKNFEYDDNKYSIIAQKQTQDFCTIYTKGSPEEMLSIIDIDSQNQKIIEEQVNNLRLLGQKSTVFAYRMLSIEETNAFCQKLVTIKNLPINSEARIEVLFQDIEINLTYLGIVGVEDTVELQTQEAISSFQKAGIKIWILSGDTENSCISTAYKAELFKKESPLFRIHNLTNSFQCTRALETGINSYIYRDGPHSLLRKPTVGIPNLIRGKSFRRKRTIKSRALTVLKVPAQFLRGDSLNSEDLIKVEKNEDQHPQFGANRLLELHTLGRQFTMRGKKKRISILERGFSPDTISYGVTIDRKSFEQAISSDESRKYLVCLLLAADSVCFYGLLPSDKAKVVKLLKENVKFKPVTLAIGIGCGDIPMIQEADVGIGISSKSYTSIMNYSDININQFSQLENLILLHGF